MFLHLPAHISRMCKRIYIFGFKKAHKETKKSSTSKFIRTNLCFFPSKNTKQRCLFFSKEKFCQSSFLSVNSCGKLYLKNLIILMIFFFFSFFFAAARPGEDFFRHLHFRKQEYYFFWPKLLNYYQQTPHPSRVTRSRISLVAIR